MSIYKVLLIVTGTLFLAIGGVSIAYGNEVEPNFSYFKDPNEGRTNQVTSKTEAEPPCITCEENGALNIQKDLYKAAKKVAEKKKKKQESEESCITCGRVALPEVSEESKKTNVTDQNIWAQYPQIASYSNSIQVKNMLSYAQRHAYSKSQGLCYRYVKQALCGASRPRCKKGSMVSGYLNGNPVFANLPSRVPKSKRLGVNAIKTLKAEGFINLLEDPEINSLIKNPASAPKGSILIYSGGRNGGHIEIKSGHGTNGSYISDFKAPNSIMRNELAGRASRRYKLVGVMIKPAEKL